MKFSKMACVLLGAGLLSSCSHDFLNTQPAGSSYSSKQLEDMYQHDPQTVAQGRLDGIYMLMTQREAGGVRNSNIDFGQKGNDLVSDFLTGDMSCPVSTYGQYVSVQNYSATSDPKNLLNYMFWRYYYKIIFGVNPIIEQMGGREATYNKADPIERNKAFMLGQALALRAYSYYYLLQYFCQTYSPDAAAVCLYTSSKQINLPLSKQKEVYQLVIDDLNQAISLLDGFDRGGHKEAINANVARGLLAYVYAAMGNYAQVKAMTSKVIDSHEFSMMTAQEVVYNPQTGTGSGFNNVRIPGWMWGVDIEASHGLGLVSFWGQMDIFTYSYPSTGDVIAMSDALYALIRPGDVRANQFGSYRSQNYVPYNKFYDSQRIIQHQSVITSDYVFMRVAEMYMLAIEADFFLGHEDDAKAKLKAFLQQRMSNADYVNELSGNDLKKEIHNQWRIEFWGEGKAYLALKRFKEDIVTGTNRLDENHRHVTIKWDDSKLSLKIPNNELINNPNLK